MNPPIKSYAGIALAATILLIPTYFLSVRIERRIYQRILKPIAIESVSRAVRVANLWPYGLLFVLALGWYGYQLAWGTETAPAVRHKSRSRG